MSNEIPDKVYVYNALLRYNYLPIGKKYPDDIPFKVFSTEDFTPAVADEMLNQYENARKIGYDQIEYRATRFNNVTRLIHIPHPLPYARLCKCISKNWEKLSHICKNPNSQLKPTQHEDRRLIMGEYEGFERVPAFQQVVMMNSEDFSDRRSQLKMSTGKFYRVKADIASFFPSIYTHSIPWAIVGQQKAKSNRDNSKWYNELDKVQRDLKRGETQGIPIGPATSNIISELILSKVDKTLRDKSNDSCEFIRYIDDYECYCETREQADNFVLNLEQKLREYLLNLNPKKVMFEELPVGIQTEWVINLRNYLPSGQQLSTEQIMSCLDSAIDLQKRYPEGSVLKYATRVLANSNKFDTASASFFLEYLIAIAVHAPSVLPILCQVAKEHNVGSKLTIEPVLQQSIKFQRSDAICWCLYFMGICGLAVSEKLAKAIIETEDCMSMGMLIALDQHQEKVVDFLYNKMNSDSEYDYDQYWLLIHELALDYSKFSCYREESGLKFLSEKNVYFIKRINTRPKT